jgi:hypothetical protein
MENREKTLIPQPLLPGREKGGKRLRFVLQLPSPALGEGLGVRVFNAILDHPVPLKIDIKSIQYAKQL